jgi:hypothetical protein
MRHPRQTLVIAIGEKSVGKWSEVTDPKEIADLNRKLKTRLQEATRRGKMFRIGTPAGHFEAEVRLAQINASQELWFYSGLHKKTGDFITLVGRHARDHSGALYIDVQFNFPNGRFGREKGGAFVKDGHGRVFLAHRGIVTRGTSRVRKSALLRHLNWRKSVIAESTVKPFEVDLLVVAALDDVRLAAKILTFAGAIRDAASLAVAQETPTDRVGAPRSCVAEGRQAAYGAHRSP